MSGGPGGAAESRAQTRLLILDEDRVEGGMLAFHLRREGLVVMLMTSPDEAIDAIAWAAPDVLLVELTGRGFDGPGFLKSLGDLEIDVFAVIDRPLDAETELDALRIGVVDILTKPLDAQALARRLRTRTLRPRRGTMPGLPEGGISGDLAVHSAMYLLQLCHRHRLNARLHVELQGDWAVLLVRHGEVIDAEAPSAAGREAAYQAIRAEAGAFVLVPMPPDAEELSRDDVVRADLATLVGDALGRREPRPVNAQRLREQDTFVLPHVGSPRSPTTRRTPGVESETLEYQGLKNEERQGRPPTARVKRPGESERAKRVEATPDPAPALPAVAPPAVAVAVAPPGDAAAKKPGTEANGRPRSPTRPMPVAPSPDEAEARFNDALKAEAESRAALQARETLDGHFDEPTDQRERGAEQTSLRPPTRPQTRPQGLSSHVVIEPVIADPGPRSRKAERVQTRSSALKRVSPPTGQVGIAGAQGKARTGARLPVIVPARETAQEEDGLEPVTHPPVARVQAPTDRQSRPAAGRGRAGPRRDPVVLGMAAAVALLTLFVIWRVAANASATPDPAPAAVVDPKLAAEPEVRFGAALAELEAGRRDQAITTLEALADEPRPPDGVLATLARLYYDTGRMAQAEALLTRLAANGDARTWAWLGLVRAERQDLDGARGAFAKARAEQPDGALEERLAPLETLLR